MAAAFLLDPNDFARAVTRSDWAGDYARHLEHSCPQHLQAVGLTASEYAEILAAPSRSIEECVRSGAMSAAEGRFIEGNATEADLVELGYSADEILLIIQDQKAFRCASSG
ncbi:MAG: hypothetical protein IPK82_10930 [Polyangiaceae bacterium]|nr:hypothetical protein [Polyangiaceae bacterium]